MDLKQYYLDQKKAPAAKTGFTLTKPQFGVEQKAYNPLNFVGEMGGQAVGGLAGAVNNTIKGAANLADTINPVNIFSRVTGIGKPVEVAKTIASPVTGAIDYSTEAIDKVQRAGGLDPNSAGGAFGKGLGTATGIVGAAMLGGGAGAAAGKVLANGSKLAQLMPFLGASFGSTEGSVMAASGKPASAGDLGIGLGIDLATLGLGKVIKSIAKKGTKAGDALYNTAIPPNAKEAELVQRNLAGQGFKPRTTADTARELGLAGTEKHIGVQAVQKYNDIAENFINPALKKTPKKFDFDDAFNSIKKQIKAEAELGRKADLTEALDALKTEYKRIHTVGFEKAQRVKVGLDKFTPQKAFRGKEIGSAYGEVKNMLADEIRQATYKILPNDTLKNAYLDLGNLRRLAEIGQKSMTGGGLMGGFGGFMSTLKQKAVVPALTVTGAASQNFKSITPTVESLGKFVSPVLKYSNFRSKTLQ